MPPQRKTAPHVSKGSGSSAGKSHTPCTNPEPEKTGVQVRIPVPIGFPISQEEYDRLKTESTKHKLGRSGASQEDPSEKQD
jgi:hypothetical protein